MEIEIEIPSICNPCLSSRPSSSELGGPRPSFRMMMQQEAETAQAAIGSPIIGVPETRTANPALRLAMPDCILVHLMSSTGSRPLAPLPVSDLWELRACDPVQCVLDCDRVNLNLHFLCQGHTMQDMNPAGWIDEGGPGLLHDRQFIGRRRR